MLRLRRRAATALKVEGLEQRCLLAVGWPGLDVQTADVAGCDLVFLRDQVTQAGTVDLATVSRGFFNQDSDGDGAPDADELRDGNKDGIDDAEQPYVASIAIDFNVFVTLAVPAYHRIEILGARQLPELPQLINVVGQVDYRVTADSADGGHTVVTWYLPENYYANSYYIGEDEFLYNPATQEGAIFGKERVTVYHDQLPVEASGTPVYYRQIGAGVDVQIQPNAMGNQLIITGTEHGDSIQVEQLGQGVYQVVGLRGAVIKGFNTPLVFTGVDAGVKVNLLRGDDYVLFGGPLHQFGIDRGQFIVDTGDGDDVVLISHSHIRGYTRIDTGAGNDTVSMADTRLRTWSQTLTVIHLGADDDRLSLYRMAVEGLVVSNGGAGNDVIDVVDSAFWWHWRRGF